MSNSICEVSNREHGGNLSDAIRRFGGAKDDWVDLSTGINPDACPLPPVPPVMWLRLPEQDDMDSLLRHAREYYDVHSNHDLLAAPGTQAVIQRLPQLVSARTTVAIMGPTYNEHANVWQSNGHTVLEVSELTDIPPHCSVTVVVNPNNPDGRVFDPGALLDITETMHERGGFLLIDEAFGDVQPHLTMARENAVGGLLILKSLGKFFGLAGLRLGFVAGDHQLVASLRNALGPWAVSGPALYVGAEALSDRNWVRDMRNKLFTARHRLEMLFQKHDLHVIGATDLFVLVCHDHAETLYEHLAAEHILTRPFSYRNTWLRFGLPGPEEDWNRLEQALATYKT